MDSIIKREPLRHLTPLQLATKKLLILPNHQSLVDSSMVMSSLFARRGLVNKVMIINNLWLKYTIPGIISWLHDDFFIRLTKILIVSSVHQSISRPGKANRELSLVEFKDHLQNVFLRKERQFLLLFPEGGFLK